MNYAAVSVFAVISLMRSAAAAQDTAGVGAIRGTVTASSGEPVADAAVCVRNLDRCTVTDVSGRFLLNDLRAGGYELEVVGPPPAPLIVAVDVRAGRETVVEVAILSSAAVRGVRLHPVVDSQ